MLAEEGRGGRAGHGSAELAGQLRRCVDCTVARCVQTAPHVGDPPAGDTVTDKENLKQTASDYQPLPLHSPYPVPLLQKEF